MWAAHNLAIRARLSDILELLSGRSSALTTSRVAVAVFILRTSDQSWLQAPEHLGSSTFIEMHDNCYCGALHQHRYFAAPSKFVHELSTGCLRENHTP